jgi:hypothetical protein
MRTNSMRKCVLAALLIASLIATGCSTRWMSVALEDLPVLTQMALNIATLVTTLQAGKQVSLPESAAIQNISAEASRDLNLLQALCNDYKQNADADTLKKIQSTIAEINTDLPAMLQAAHISDPVLLTRLGAAVNLIVSTVNNFAVIMPQVADTTSRKSATFKGTVPNASQLRTSWNRQVCAPTGKPAIDVAFARCAMR